MIPVIPAAARYTIANATAPVSVLGEAGSGALRRVDIAIAEGRIAAIVDAGAGPPTGPVHDLDAGLVLPAFVDVHTHLDKGNTWPRQPNPDGTWLGALLAVAEDREARWSARDVERRMEFSLRTAYAHGTAAIRTHLDSALPQLDTTWDVFDEVRARWADRIELQAVSIVGPDELLDDATRRQIGRRVQQSAGLIGGAVGVHPQARDAVFRAVECAGELDLGLDLHCDENGDPDSLALRHLADAVIETGFTGSVFAGHCCALAVQDEKTAMTTVERVARAGIAIVSLAMCNLYLQDRGGANGVRTPRWRGVTLLNEFKAAGVPVALASDNTRDPFYAYGDLDLLEVLREGARILHIDHPQSDAFDWVRSISSAPAAVAGFAHGGTVTVGAPADLVLFGARSWTELMARPQADRVVLRQGRAIDRTLPDFRELDDLME